MSPVKQRVRQTSAVERRAENMRKVVDLLRAGEITRVEVQTALAMSPSGARSYIRELRDSEVMILDRCEPRTYVHYRDHSPGEAIFRINTDPQIVASFLDRITEPKRIRQAALSKTIDAEPGRHIHVMADDVNYSIKPAKRKIPAHTELMAAFYGMGIAQVEA
jgi:hypothetical protein